LACLADRRGLLRHQRKDPSALAERLQLEAADRQLRVRLIAEIEPLPGTSVLLGNWMEVARTLDWLQMCSASRESGFALQIASSVESAPLVALDQEALPRLILVD
jgi:hypothetical protein